MKSFAHIIAATIILILAGCAGGIIDPISPPDSHDLPSARSANTPVTHLWGYYDISIDPATGKATIITDRSAQFAANVVTFLNAGATNLTIIIHNIVTEPDYTDIDLDVYITHPFPGKPQFNGYDVRGVFMGDGSQRLEWNNDLLYPVDGVDQSMPIGHVGSPDGYTRWFNATEFLEPGILGYTEGRLASKGYRGTATLCPYKYFANGLASTVNYWEFLKGTSGDGMVSAGATVSRRYFIRFPKSKGIRFAYAVVANWEDPMTHPSNALEAVGCKFDVTPDLWYENETTYGGDLIADISVFDWHSEYSGGWMNDYNIFIESTVLDTPYELGWSEMTPVDGDDHWSTYHVEIPADAIPGSEGNEAWIIVEYPQHDYTNDFGVPNEAGYDPLAAFFRFDVPVSDEAPSSVICDVQIDPSSPPMPYVGGPAEFTFDASGSYDIGGAPLPFEWDFDNDGTFGDPYDSGTDEIPTRIFTEDNHEQVCVQVSNGIDVETCCVDVDITIDMGGKNIQLRDGFDAMDIGVDHTDGDLLILYSDGIVWKYTEAGEYEDGEEFYVTYEPGSQYLDVAPNSYSVIGFHEYNYADVCRMYDPDGVWVSDGYISSQCWVHDVIAFTGHTYTNMMGVSTFSCPMGTWFNWKMHEPPDYTNYFWAYLNVEEGCGPNAFERDADISCECGNIDMQWVYYLEGSAPGCDEYRVQRVYRPSGSELVNEAMWGGEHTDGMEGFWDPRDITRDIDNDFYILDYLSTEEPLVKKYADDSTAIGSFGDSTTIAGEPLRIEGSDYEGTDGNLIFVLHDGGPDNPDLLSIFYPDEIPD